MLFMAALAPKQFDQGGGHAVIIFSLAQGASLATS
jgi:hypothetical protein